MQQTVEKTLSALKLVGSLEERKWKGNFKIRVILFDRILRGMKYGSDLWEWERQPRLVKYIKWTLLLIEKLPIV